MSYLLFQVGKTAGVSLNCHLARLSESLIFLEPRAYTVMSLQADNQDRKHWACACAHKLTFMALLEFSPLYHLVDVTFMFS